MINKIVTRGLGVARSLAQSSGIVVQGYGPTVPSAIVVTVTEATRRRHPGQSGTKRRLEQLDEFIVWARLVEVNGQVPNVDVRGMVKGRLDASSGRASVIAEHIESKTRDAWETVKVIVRRL